MSGGLPQSPSQAYFDGIKAYQEDGASEEDNPYLNFTFEHREWERGRIEARNINYRAATGEDYD